MIAGIENFLHERQRDVASITVGLERKKNSGRLFPTYAGQGVEDRKNDAVAIVPGQRDVPQQSSVLCVVFVVGDCRHALPRSNLAMAASASVPVRARYLSRMAPTSRIE